MNKLPKFNGIEDHFLENSDLYKDTYDSPNPQEVSLIISNYLIVILILTNKMKLPGDWDEKLDELEKMIFLKFIRSDKIISAV